MDDVLLIQSAPEKAADFAVKMDLGLQYAGATDSEEFTDDEYGVAEIILPSGSGLIGKTLVESRFGNAYGLNVIGVKRPGRKRDLDIGTMHFRFGDSLLVQGTWSKIMALKSRRRDFIVTGQPIEYLSGPYQKKSMLAFLILLLMITLIVLEVVPVAVAALVAALLMVLTGCLTMDQGYKAINWQSLVLIAGMIPLATALDRVGLVDSTVNYFVAGLGDFGPRAVLAGLFLLTAFFTQVLSNTATTVVVAPVGLAAAQSLNVEPYAFMMGIAVAASMGFASPVASPVNTLVMGAGNYRFEDYLRVGTALILISMIVTVAVLPWMFPF